MKKINSEKALNCSAFKIKVGTTDRNIADIIYINGSCYIEPINDDDMKKRIEDVKRGIDKYIKQLLKKALIDNYILTFDIPDEERIKSGKRTNFSLQLIYRTLRSPYKVIKNGFKQYLNTIAGQTLDMDEDEGEYLNTHLVEDIKSLFQLQGFKVYKSKK